MKSAEHEIVASPLRAGEVHAFVVSLDMPENALAEARACLSTRERARADAFLRGEDRRHFTAARSWLRRVLGTYLDRAPSDVAFGEGPHGKPRLLETPGGREGEFDFNLSHSGGHALLVVSPGLEIGADIEAIREIEEKVAHRFFSAAEVRALVALPVGKRRDAFFRCWTRKEAYLKALGSGLAAPLDGFTVSLGEGEARLLEVAGEPGEAEAWQFVHLDPAPGFVGAIAARQHGWTPRWPDRARHR